MEAVVCETELMTPCGAIYSPVKIMAEPHGGQSTGISGNDPKDVVFNTH